MKKTIKIISLILSICVLFSISAMTPAHADNEVIKYKINGKNYIRTFYDEFGGRSLDTTKWELCPEWGRQNNYCYWDDSMTSLDGNGHLLLNCEYDANGTLLCGAIRTKNLFYQRYGYFEISVKLQKNPGFWSAFWLMPDYIDTGAVGGADGTEIDIFEAFSVKESRINYGLHFDGYGENHKSVGKQVVADVYDGNFHNFALEWDEDKYVFYIDGQETCRLTPENSKDSSGTALAISRIPTYLKISLEAGSWTGKPKKEDTPDGIVVDYVKVYQREDYYAKTNPLKGDLNDDCFITVADVKLMRELLSKYSTSMNTKNADVNKDKSVDVKDCLLMRKYLANEITTLP